MLLGLVADTHPIVQLFPALLAGNNVALVCGIHLCFSRSMCGVSRLYLRGGLRVSSIFLIAVWNTSLACLTTIRSEDHIVRIKTVQFASYLDGSIRVRIYQGQLTSQPFLNLVHRLIREVHRIRWNILLLLDPVREAKVLRDGLLARPADHRCTASRSRLGHLR